MRFSTSLYAFLLILFPFFANAQDNLSIQDKMEITYRAEQMVKELNNLFNLLTNSGIYESEYNILAKGAYSSSTNQLFFSEKAIIEDDLNPEKADHTNVTDVEVSSYLKELFLTYEKSDDYTISFDNFKVSKIYEKNYAYTMVSYESTFRGKHKVIKKPYKTTRRVAQIRFKRENDKWKTYISSIIFQKPTMEFEEANYEEEYVNDMSGTNARLENLSTEDSTQLASLKSQFLEEFLEGLERKDRQEEQQKQEASQRLMKEGDLAFDENDFETALIAYQRSQDLTPYEVEPFLKISKARRAKKAQEEEQMQEEQRFQNYAKAGAYNFRIRDYEAAINNYQKAQNLRPRADSIAERLREIRKVTIEKESVETKARTGDYTGAIRDITRAIKASPGNPDYYLSRAHCYEQTGKAKKAIEDYSQAISLHDEYLNAYLKRGNLYELDQQPAQAELDFERAVSLKPDSTELHIRLSKIRQRLGDNNGAIKDYNTAIKQRPTDGKLFLERGMLHLLTKNTQAAFNDFSDALTLTPSLAQAWYQRGKLRVAQQAIPEAADDFRRAKKEGLDASSWQTVINYAIAFYNQGYQSYQRKEYADAVSLFTKAVTLNSQYAEAWFARGQAREDSQEFIAAMNDYGEAVKHKPTYSDAYFRRGSIRYARQDYVGAASDFGSASTHRPDFIEAHISHGRALNNLKDYEPAILAYKKALSYNSKLADVYYEMGLIYMTLEKYAQAQLQLNQAIRNRKNFAEAYYERGMSQYHQQIYSKAVKDFSTALQYKTPYAQAYYARGIAQMDLRKASRALPDFRKAIDQGIRPLAEAYERRGYAEFALGLYPQAVESWEKTLVQNTNASQDLYLSLGEACTHAKQWEKAKSYFQEILALDSRSYKAHYGLAGCYAGMGLNSEALEHLEPALQSGKYTSVDLKKNPFFKLLRKDPGYKALASKYL